ncbi:MAG: acyl carrier protein [Chitinivibrionales bacterium]|nr:acyl carrier protein [Chitinivibrionales bacterium]
MSDTLERVIKVTANLLRVDPEKITPESRFVQDLGAESMQSVELAALYEEEFDVEMDEDEALSIKSVGEAVKYIEKVRTDL